MGRHGHVRIGTGQKNPAVNAAAFITHLTWLAWAGMSLALLIGLIPLISGLPEDEARVLRSTLVGVAVWGCP